MAFPRSEGKVILLARPKSVRIPGGKLASGTSVVFVKISRMLRVYKLYASTSDSGMNGRIISL